MKNHRKYFLFISIFSGVFLGYFFTPINYDIILDIDLSGNLIDFDFNFNIFKKIFLNNILVGLIISIGGYFSYGILSYFVLFWNGLSLGCLFTVYHNLSISLAEFSSMFIFHGLSEFYALFLFGIIGLKGVHFYKHFFNVNEININLNFKEFLLPVSLILISAIVETILISNF